MLKFFKSYIFTALAVVAGLSSTSCNEPMFDSEGDCEVTHTIRFRYERNLKWADAFPSEVNSVNLYVFDSNGRFVKEYLGRGETLSKSDYGIELDLPVGSYRFLAWCGLENDGVEMESFTVPQPVAGVTTIEEMTCSLNTERESRAEGAAYSDTQLRFLYHGYLEATLEDHHDGRHYEYTMSLTKDTNHIRVILHELGSDSNMNEHDYDFAIEAANGVLGYDNNPLGNEVITYRPWWQDVSELGVGKVESEEGIQFVTGVYADLTTSRMMVSQDMQLTIRNHTTQEEIISVPLIQYALLFKKYYESTYRHTMGEQEFLDREDEYVLTFFLLNGKWEETILQIHSWRIVRQNHELGWQR